MSANTDLLEELWAAWAEKDVDRIMGYFADDPVYTNVALGPPNEGTAAVRKAIEGFCNGWEEVEFVTHFQLENEQGVVMNERTDRFLARGKWVECLVMGVFEIEDGKIRAWRDYFDREQFASQRRARD